MIQEISGLKPQIDPRAFVHELAVIIGDVVVEEDANIWPGAVLRGDIERILIKAGASIQDGAVLHTDKGYPTNVGKGTVIGHGCIIHGCRIGNHTLVGMGAIVLTGAEIGDDCVIGAGALIPEGKTVPSGSVMIGLPARNVRNTEERDRARIRETAAAYQELVKKYKP
ncbi:MAG: gamma carbonic anhydrase family protein [Candidatus Verstraetearchaeota archaeon]|nr:gamma carbonic anhydrase family protein [Candidatus Verstraetearchaeota archaeon]